jgi:hypothetical protein
LQSAPAPILRDDSTAASPQALLLVRDASDEQEPMRLPRRREQGDEHERAVERSVAMDPDRQLRDHLVHVLRGGNAHMPFAEAVAEFPQAQINTRPPRVAYTFWHLVEHLRMTQADILTYLTAADYQAPAWPRDYWPALDARATKQVWDQSVAAFQRDLEAIVRIVTDDGTDLFGTVPSHDEHTVLREVLIVADHNAYHIGELSILRQVTNAWSRRHSVE